MAAGRVALAFYCPCSIAVRRGLVAGYAAPPEPSCRPAPRAAPGRVLTRGDGPDGLLLHRQALRARAVWQYTAIDVGSAYCWAELHLTPRIPSARWTSEL